MRTLSASSNDDTGSVGVYSARPDLDCEPAAFALPPVRAMLRVAAAAEDNAAWLMSSEYANAVFSPDTTRTPTPWSILKLPDFTWPSSRLQPSEREYWKYKSA